MAEVDLFYYFGDDEAYFRTLQGEFKRHTKLQIQFERHYSGVESEIQAFFLKIVQNQPRCVFIDFSKDTQDYLHLARLIARSELESQPLAIGLVDYLSPKDVLAESIATGINITHIKSAEVFDVVFDVGMLLGPENIAAHGFATAALTDTWEAGVVSKVGYVTGEGLHLETNFSLTKGDRVEVEHFWMKDKLIPSKEMFVTHVTDKNLFYHFTQAVDLDFVVLNEFFPPEGMDDVTVKERKDERTELIRRHKKKLAAWIEDNLSRSQEKKMKFLIIDQGYGFYRSQMRTDKYPYIIRSVPVLKDIAGDLGRMCPQLIAIVLQAPENKSAKLDFDFLEKLVNVVKRDHADSTPFVVVFNTKLSTMELRSQLRYDHLMATDGDLEADVLIKMAGLLEKKLSKIKIVAEKSEPKVFIRKTIPASLALIMTNITVSKLSETDIVFTSEKPLTPGMNLAITKPVPFFVNVQPSKTQGKVPEYTGLIHAIGESDKKELRRFINSVFFRDHDATQNNETEEFKKLNEAKLQQKLEAIRIAQEKIAAEAAAKATPVAAEETPDDKKDNPA